ncbi:predicted protein [Naegleria gruberi]|uniref:Predicted protein n=1 Tax=Naegleria gruberi TaxID=5762 RepID=D2VKA7_NAEGR|nr:uncharacterized protein NAEGRDRAFT_69327 [Naegleria gruberi]EFC42830.1 predicted protein [Naegleria gruberi]|eukprot:XP_002675574.1 predicted protein [Naegleria gruberi strain NEG-M]
MSAQKTWFLHHSPEENNSSGSDICSPSIPSSTTTITSNHHHDNGNDNNSDIHATKCTRYTNTILIYVNGIRYLIDHPNPEQTLGDYLRVNLQLTGTKIGCSEGGCGACVVMISHYDHQLNRIINRSVNACLYPLIAADGYHIVTVEGVGTTRDDMLHLIQQRVRLFHASQCGFCTPGFIMSLYVLLRNNPHPTLEDVERSLDGNLCRCTGYRPTIQEYLVQYQQRESALNEQDNSSSLTTKNDETSSKDRFTMDSEVLASNIGRGTPVTIENFREWRDKFVVEQKKIMEKQRIEKAKKLPGPKSGREIFEERQQLLISKIGEAAAANQYVEEDDIDEDLFLEDEDEEEVNNEDEQDEE